MPDTTIVRFLDGAGLERVAVRERGDVPYDENGDPVVLPLADLGQDESGALARGYRDNPALLLSFLDSFCDLARIGETARRLLAQLFDNAAEIERTTFRAQELKDLQLEQDRLAAQFKATEGGRLEELAVWANQLATQAALMARLREQAVGVQTPGRDGVLPSLKELADQTKTDLTRQPVSPLVGQIETSLASINSEVARLRTQRANALARAVVPLDGLLGTWQEGHSEFQQRLEKKQAELEAQGLKVEAGEIRRLGKRMEEVSRSLSSLKERQRAHAVARNQRDGLLRQLMGNWEERYGVRRSTLRRISDEANDGSLGLRIHVSFQRQGEREPWADWLRAKFGFRSPRVERLAELLLPQQFAAQWLSDWAPLLGLLDSAGDGAPFFSRPQLEGTTMTWQEIFNLETMHVEDRAHIGIEETGRTRREFDELSAGQQRSVLLSLLLVAKGSDPLVIDQPEDHLDAPYVASAIVHHLERAKERRQVIMATHSANITVLGDAELVVPLYVEGGHGQPMNAGAVDRPETLKRVCELLEGGANAYRRRGERYGFQFSNTPSID
jgi:hypothetical protein